jgi:hypothetical protein
VRASHAKNVAELLPDFMGFLNNKGIASTIQSQFEARFDEAVSLLERSGARGVLLAAQVEARIQDGFGRLIDDSLLLVGAGDKPFEVLAFSDEAKNVWLPQPSAGFRLDQDRSTYLWLVQLDDGYEMRFIDYRANQNATRQFLTDRALYEQTLSAAQTRQLEEIGQQLVQQPDDRERKKLIEDLVARRNATLSRLAEIDRELNDELRRIDKMNRVANTFGMMAQVFGIASAVSGSVSELGSDAPDGVGLLQDADAVEAALSHSLSEREAHRQELYLERDLQIQTRNGLYRELRRVYVDSGVPIQNIPAVRLDPP